MSHSSQAPIRAISLHGRSPAAQKGVVLLFALIALVAMTLAALGLMRSAETSNLVAGNIALKQGAMQEADRVMNTAFACLDSGGALLSLPLTNDSATCHYYASLQPDAQKPFGIPDVLEATAGTTDPTTGNTSAYVIERLCKNTGTWDEQTCLASPFGKPPGYGNAPDEGQLTPPQALYRISIKVSGPRNVASYSQMVLNAGI